MSFHLVEDHNWRLPLADRDLARETDIPVGFGGEEFNNFLVGSSVDGTRDLAEFIRLAIEQHRFEINPERNLEVTVSIGVAVRNQFAPLDDVIRRADESLCRAKKSGRNQVELG